MMIYVQLFWEFFKTGLFAIGGGMATIPFLYEISDKTGWFTHGDLANMVAVSESTPGPIGVNMATYVGFITGSSQGNALTGVLGSILATLGLITPSIIVILIIAGFLQSFRNSKYVNSAFYGLRPASTGLITSAGITVAMSVIFFEDKLAAGLSAAAVNWKGLVLAAVLWIFINKVKKTKGLHPIIFIAVSAVIGIVFAM